MGSPFGGGMGRMGVPHPRPAPWVLGVVDPLADPSVQLLAQLCEFLDRKVVHAAHPPARWGSDPRRWGLGWVCLSRTD